MKEHSHLYRAPLPVHTIGKEYMVGRKGFLEFSSFGLEHLAQEEKDAGKKQCQSKFKLKVRLGKRN